MFWRIPTLPTRSSRHHTSLSIMDSYLAFPTKKPSKTKLHAILQIDFTLGKSNDGFVDVWSSNNYLIQDQAYLWRVIPDHYYKNISRALFRLEVLKVASKDTKNKGGNPWHIEHAQLNLLHIDSVLDSLWEDVLLATSQETMSTTWRSPGFDHWLCTELYVRRHSPIIIESWLKESPMNSTLLAKDSRSLSAC
jgi:hypothetical protein